MLLKKSLYFFLILNLKIHKFPDFQREEENGQMEILVSNIDYLCCFRKFQNAKNYSEMPITEYYINLYYIIYNPIKL